MINVRVYPVGSRIHLMGDRDDKEKKLSEFISEFPFPMNNHANSNLYLSPTSQWVLFEINGSLNSPDPDRDTYMRYDLDRHHAIHFRINAEAGTDKLFGEGAASRRKQEFTNLISRAGRLHTLLLENANKDLVAQYLGSNTTFETAKKAYEYTFQTPLFQQRANTMPLNDINDDDSSEEEEISDDDYSSDEELSPQTNQPQPRAGSLVAVSTQRGKSMVAFPYHLISQNESDAPNGYPRTIGGLISEHRMWQWYGSRTSPLDLIRDLTEEFVCNGVYDASGRSQFYQG